MEVIGVLNSWVTGLMKLPCCSFSRISRTRNVVFRIMPRIIVAKTITPRNNITLCRQFRMIQPTSSATASATRDIPSTRKNAMVLRRLEMRIVLAESHLIVPRRRVTAHRIRFRGHFRVSVNIGEPPGLILFRVRYISVGVQRPITGREGNSAPKHEGNRKSPFNRGMGISYAFGNSAAYAEKNYFCVAGY